VGRGRVGVNLKQGAVSSPSSYHRTKNSLMYKRNLRDIEAKRK
jgi:hypothetical protein